MAVDGPARTSGFLAATHRGIFATADDGSVWTELTRGVRDTTNLAVSPVFAADGVAFSATRSGLFSTGDAGATWSAVPAAPLRAGFIEGVAVAPTFADDGLVLASVRGHGLYRSTDGGRTFAAVGSDLTSAGLELSNYPNATAVPIVFSPTFERDRTVYGFSNATVVRSVDAGMSWTTLDIPRATHDRAENSGSVLSASESGADGSSIDPGSIAAAGLGFAMARARGLGWTAVEAAGSAGGSVTAERRRAGRLWPRVDHSARGQRCPDGSSWRG